MHFTPTKWILVARIRVNQDQIMFLKDMLVELRKWYEGECNYHEL